MIRSLTVQDSAAFWCYRHQQLYNRSCWGTTFVCLCLLPFVLCGPRVGPSSSCNTTAVAPACWVSHDAASSAGSLHLSIVTHLPQASQAQPAAAVVATEGTYIDSRTCVTQPQGCHCDTALLLCSHRGADLNTGEPQQLFAAKPNSHYHRHATFSTFAGTLQQLPACLVCNIINMQHPVLDAKVIPRTHLHGCVTCGGIHPHKHPALTNITLQPCLLSTAAAQLQSYNSFESLLQSHTPLPAGARRDTC